MKWTVDVTEYMFIFENKGFDNADDQLYELISVSVDGMGTIYAVQYINLLAMY